MGKIRLVPVITILAVAGLAVTALSLERKAKMEGLSPMEFCVLREKATEPAFSGAYWNHHEKGTYVCKGCGTPLFSSETKYNSGSGWPSFWQPIDSLRLHFETDTSWGMTRIEVTCAKCGGHLGHVFEDGPQPTGKRFCINSASLDFQSSK